MIKIPNDIIEKAYIDLESYEKLDWKLGPQAINLLEPMIKWAGNYEKECALEKLELPTSFESEIEQKLFELNNEDGSVRTTTYPFSRLYRTYSNWLRIFERNEESLRYMEKAFFYNPASIATMKELLDRYHKMGDYRVYESVMRNFSHYVHKDRHLKMLYCALAHYLYDFSGNKPAGKYAFGMYTGDNKVISNAEYKEAFDKALDSLRIDLTIKKI